MNDVRKMRTSDYEFAEGEAGAESSESEIESDMEGEINDRSLNDKSDLGGRSMDRAK